MNGTPSSWDKVEPLVEKMKAKYPPEINIEALDPALTQDICEIVEILLAEQSEAMVKAVEAERERIERAIGMTVMKFGHGREELKYIVECLTPTNTENQPHYESRDNKPVWVSYNNGEEVVEPYQHQDNCFAELCASPKWCRCSD